MIIELTKEETQKLNENHFVRHKDFYIILDNNRCYVTKIYGKDDDKWEVHLYKEKK